LLLLGHSLLPTAPTMPDLAIRPTEIEKAAKACRRALSEGMQALDRRQTQTAYAAFERAQNAAFDAKSLVQNGGKYEAPGII
jgi:hypothetical protein